jgi:hypothetical protein
VAEPQFVSAITGVRIGKREELEERERLAVGAPLEIERRKLALGSER